LTRAKHLLVVFGKSETLNLDEKWKTMIEKVKEIKCKADLFDDNLVKDDA
jgi:superfamily I DNA and/or RNA helicase